MNCKCPNCGGDGKRETDVMDTFVSSSWYQFRFMDPYNQEVFAQKEKINYWWQVDHYEGTIEHFTAHLIYARFICMVLYDEEHVPFEEPFLNTHQ